MQPAPNYQPHEDIAQWATWLCQDAYWIAKMFGRDRAEEILLLPVNSQLTTEQRAW